MLKVDSQKSFLHETPLEITLTVKCWLKHSYLKVTDDSSTQQKKVHSWEKGALDFSNSVRLKY